MLLPAMVLLFWLSSRRAPRWPGQPADERALALPCLLYTSDAADERSSVDLGGRRIITKKNERERDRARGTK